LCAALDYAHNEMVIHRDLKPANMMVDSRGHLKLADFGIAAVVSDSMSRVSARHSTSGTLPYMSPQQVTGKSPQATDDIYALGATLYELLTGQLPFNSGDITHQILHEPPEPMEERLAALGTQNEIPGDVAALVMACLAKESGQRPQSARVVAEWIGLELDVKPSTESLAAVLFPQTPFSPGTVGDMAAGKGGSKPAVYGRKLAAVAVVVLVLAAAFWLRKGVHHGDHSTPPVAAKVPTQTETARESKAPPVGIPPETASIAASSPKVVAPNVQSSTAPAPAGSESKPLRVNKAPKPYSLVPDAIIKQEADNLETVKRAPDRAALDDQIAKAKTAVDLRKAGRIAVGRVTLEGTEDPAYVSAQMLILPGGYFATDIKDLNSPLTFRMHGYAALDVDLYGKEGDIVDLGTVRMKKLPSSELRQISGIIVSEYAMDFRNVNVLLSVQMGPVNTLSGGYSGRRNFPNPIKVLPDQNGHFSAGGFSPGPVSYRLSINTPGYELIGKRITLDRPEGLDVGTIKLTKLVARQCKLSYVVAEAPPFNIAKVRQQTVPSEEEWNATPNEYDCRLKFEQHDGKIQCVTHYGPCLMVDLGEGTLQDFANTSVTPSSHLEGRPMDAIVGHVYLLHQWSKHLVLFKVESMK
jgi:hypothetical protein